MNISIITVVLNDLENLKLTYKSLLNQTSKEFEWIIKDGGSKDGTKEYVEVIINMEDFKIDYLQIADKSIYDAMNQAMPYANGEYTLFLNAGDTLYSNNTISQFLNSIKDQPLYDFVYGDNYDVTVNGELIYKKARPISYLEHSLPTSHQAIFYNRKLFNEYQYDLKFRIAADYAFTAQAYFDGNVDYLKLNFPICRFSLGGMSSLKRNILLKEGYIIHRKIVKDNIIIAGLKLIKRYVIFILLDHFPNLYSLIRKFADRNKN